MSEDKKQLLVIGNGMVGYKFLEKFSATGGMDEYKVTVFGEEPRPAYDRVHLSEYFSGKTAEDLMMAPAEWYKENDIKLICNARVTEIDREGKNISTDKVEGFEYDKLVMATGSSAFVPPVPGVDAEGIFVYRTIEDLEGIIAYARGRKSAAVVGGGLLGLEAAKAVVDMGLEAHVVEFAPRLMPRQLDEKAAECLKSKIEELGCTIHLNKGTKNIEEANGSYEMHFAEDDILTVDMIIISAGIRPRDELAKSCGLEVGERGGITVNSKMETSDPDIYAIGECALYEGMIYGLVAPGYRMAEVAGKNLLGGSEEFLGADMSTKLKLMGIDVCSFGDPFGDPEKTREIIIENKAAGMYKKLVVDDKVSRVLGGILVGDSTEYSKLHQMYLGDMPLPTVPESLLVTAPGDEGDSSVAFLPSSAVVCNCENITKGQVVDAIRNDGVTDMDGIKSCTKAGTGCGGCVPIINDILKSELESQGKEIDKTLCQHFDMTRQELYTVIRRDKLQTFDAVLGVHGKGDGCEICKPAVASIISSCWNKPILNEQKIQDTNDYFLANMQKNGTYSVVPRVPGGEIMPEQLIEIGKIAKDFNLYTKITGGQRIDMFGARVEDLPKIWERLREVGMESGHAYGKSLRTVKSCVGQTWCRFGVQDSTTLAIDIENRYKGLRAPHKLKGAVSGCVRECAEAQSKDFGVIATDKGWNLYLGGNGGAKPQHAQLFATDLSREEVFTYLDRFLMYYIRTADRLTRTAPWLNNLDGGLEHLKDVIIHDKLGIAEELDKEMEENIANYHCEWADVLDDPEKLKRFKSFINSEEKDPAVQFEEERGQIKPAVTIS